MWSAAYPWDTSSYAELLQKNEKYPSSQAAAQQSEILQGTNMFCIFQTEITNQYFPEVTRGDIYQGKGYRAA